jgi:hypothetical protein
MHAHGNTTCASVNIVTGEGALPPSIETAPRVEGQGMSRNDGAASQLVHHDSRKVRTMKPHGSCSSTEFRARCDHEPPWVSEGSRPIESHALEWSLAAKTARLQPRRDVSPLLRDVQKYRTI